MTYIDELDGVVLNSIQHWAAATFQRQYFSKSSHINDDVIDLFKEKYALIFRTNLSTFLKKSIITVIYSFCKEVTSIMQVTT